MFRRLTKIMAILTVAVVAPLTANAASVVETAASAGQFNTLLAAAKAAGLADALATKRNITVFAPTDAAFAHLPKGTVDNLLRPENKEKLQAILLYHVLPNEVRAGEVPTRKTKVATLDQGKAVTVRRHGKNVRVNNAQVIKADIGADNGVIHVINRVLIPGH